MVGKVMSNIYIDATNISKVVRFLLKIDIKKFQKSHAEQVNALLSSLNVGWKAYNYTQVNFPAGDTEINISDNYLQALINTANFLYKILDNDSQQQLQKHLQT
jgi:hypothetical protein